MKKVTLIIITALALNLMLAVISPVGHAEDILNSNLTFNVKENLNLGETTATGSGQQTSYFGSDSPITAFVTKVIQFATYIIGSIAIVLVIVAGFMFMVSQGNQQKIDEAKDILKYVIIGLIIVFMSYIITIFVQSIFLSAE